jgi:hypothetical protein
MLKSNNLTFYVHYTLTLKLYWAPNFSTHPIQNGTILGIKIIIICLKKKRKKKKKKKNRGCPSHPLGQKWGWFDHPQKAKNGGGLIKRPNLFIFFFRKKKRVLGFWGWPNHPQGHGGGFGYPLQPV